MQLTTSRAAKILGTSEGTVRALARRGELPCTRTATGVRLFEPADVERLAAARAARQADSASTPPTTEAA